MAKCQKRRRRLWHFATTGYCLLATDSYTPARSEPDGADGTGGTTGASASRLISSFSSLPGLKYGTFFGGTSTLSPVLGLRPLRGSRRRNRKLPNPRSSIFSPRGNASMMVFFTVSTMNSACFFVRSETRDTSSTSSAFVMLPVFITRSLWSLAVSGQLLLVLEVIAQRHFRPSGRLGIGFPVGAELLVLQRADAQADLPLGRDQLDDLHLVALTHLQIQLAVLALLRRFVEFRDVDQAFDAFRELDERAEVRHPHDLAFDRVADVMLLEELVPDIGLSCFRPSDRRWFSASMLSTIASTLSPFFSASEGCFRRLLHD